MVVKFSQLQKLFKPIYDLTRKSRQFIWGKEQQEAFEEIKRRLMHVNFSFCFDIIYK